MESTRLIGPKHRRTLGGRLTTMEETFRKRSGRRREGGGREGEGAENKNWAKPPLQLMKRVTQVENEEGREAGCLHVEDTRFATLRAPTPDVPN